MPFRPLRARVYAGLLKDELVQHNMSMWLLNTGWTGGPYGVGERIKPPNTRAMVAAALEGALDEVPSWTEPTFGLRVPEGCSGVPDALLHPRQTWANATSYDAQAQHLASLFRVNVKS